MALHTIKMLAQSVKLWG